MAPLWLARIVSDGSTGNPSAKRFGLILSVSVLTLVMAVIGGVIAGVTWAAQSGPQAVELVRIISGTLEVLAGLVLAAVTTGYVAGKAVERSGAKAPPETAGTP